MAASAAGVRSVTSTHASPPRTSASASGAADATESITTTGTSRTVPRSAEVLNPALRRRRCRPASERDWGGEHPSYIAAPKAPDLLEDVDAEGVLGGPAILGKPRPAEQRGRGLLGAVSPGVRSGRIRGGEGAVFDCQGDGARAGHARHPCGEHLARSEVRTRRP